LRSGTWGLFCGDRKSIRFGVLLLRDGAQVPAHFESISCAYRRYGTFEVQQRESERFLSDAVILRHSQKSVLLDFHRGEVLRSSRVPFTDEYEVLRTAFSQHVRSIGFSISSDRMELRETIALGAAIGETPMEHRVDVLREMLRELQAHIASEVAIGRGEVASSMRRGALMQAPFLEAQALSDQVDATLGTEALPLVAVHGDLIGTNVIVEPGGRHLVIDFGEVHLGPFWRDPLIVANQAPATWMAGGFDAELAEIWSAAGHRPIRWTPEAARLALLADASLRAFPRVQVPEGALQRIRVLGVAERLRRGWNDEASALSIH